LEYISDEGGMYGFGLDILGNRTYSEWSISNEEDILIDSGTTGPMSFDPSTNEIGFDLFDSYYYNDLMFTGEISGNSNPYDIINGHLESTPIPEPSTILLVCSGIIGLAGFRNRFRKA